MELFNLRRCSGQEEALRDYIFQLAFEHLGVLLDDLEDETRFREVWILL